MALVLVIHCNRTDSIQLSPEVEPTSGFFTTSAAWEVKNLCLMLIRQSFALKSTTSVSW